MFPQAEQDPSPTYSGSPCPAVRALRRASWRSALSVFVSLDGRIIGAILLADELRRETPLAVQSLRAAGVRRIVMVTGDRAEAAETDVIILVDRLDRVADAVAIARRTRAIAVESIVAGMAMSGLAMLAAAAGWPCFVYMSYIRSTSVQ